jgi:hypothetical protein
MPDPAQTLRLLATLSLLIPLLAHGQATPPLNDAERARRDAEKVLSFIKFQTVKTPKPPNEPADKPRRASVPSTPSAPTTAQPAATAPPHVTTAARQPEAGVALAPTHTALATTSAPSLVPQPPQPATSFGASPAAASEAEQEADDGEAELQIQHFVSPVLPPSVQKTLGSGTRKVIMRFTVQPDGSVSQAAAAEDDVPGRLVRPATEAILQWRFAPLAHARTVDVEIAFKRD